jgi:hypothetical protein
VEAVLEEQDKGEMARGKGQNTTSAAGEVDPFDATPSHSTRLSAEELLAGHPKDGSQVAGYSATEPKKKKATPIDDAAHPSLFSDNQE